MRGRWLSGLGIVIFSFQARAADRDLCGLRPSSFGFQKPATIAVIDTGLDTQIPFFRDNLWTNPGETGLDGLGRDKRTNGVDDDGNGFVDDVHGWNFAGRNNYLRDEVGHGTHVAGLIVNGGREILSAAVPMDRGFARIMVLKYHDGRNLKGRGPAFQKA
ncbi:MAG TPA: S8 family serine peptidase, partial [Pseudobdellovibrionaceae bacterium]|nr:S8 family serine peptidase [Pseudobdellovibrionaceae bacterium]